MLSRRKIPALTGIRGFAAVWVMAFHVWPFFADVLGLSLAVPVVPYGYLGVDIFFVLSGFVLGLSHATEIAEVPGTAIRRFFVGRAFRILPLHWFMLIVMGVLVLTWPNELGAANRTLPNFIATFFLVQSWGLGDPWSWNWPSWSLSTEFAAYLLFPFLVFFATLRLRTWRTNLAASTLCLVAFVAMLTVLHRHDLGVTGFLSLPRCIFEFAAGFFLYRAAALGCAERINPDAVFATGCAVSIAAVVMPSLQFLSPFGFAAVILGCALWSPASSRVFGNAIMRYLGEISYSLYLVHAVALVAFEAVFRAYQLDALSWGSRLALLVAFSIGVFVIATLTWTFIEKPGQKAASRLSGFRPRAAKEVTAA